MKIDSMFKRKIFFILWVALSVITGIVGVFLIYSGITDEKIFDVFFNSRTLYLQTLFNDLLTNGFLLNGWNFGEELNFFPDVFIYYLTALFFRDNFLFTYVFYSIFQYILLIIGLYLLSTTLFTTSKFKKEIGLSSIIFLNTFFITIAFAPFNNINYYFVSILNLNSPFIFAIYLFYIVLKYFDTKKIKYSVLYFILLSIAYFSNKFIFVTFVLPYLLLSGFLLISKTSNFSKQIYKLGYFSILSILFSYIFLNIIQSVYLFDLTNLEYDFKNIADSAFNLFLDLFFIFYNSPIYLILGIPLYFTIYLLSKYLFKKDSSVFIKSYSFFSISQILSIIGYPVVVGFYYSIDNFGYIYFIFLIGLINGILLFEFYNPLRILYFTKILSIFSFVIVLSSIMMSNKVSLLDTKPLLISKIDIESNKFETKVGISNFWWASKNSLFSDSSLVILSVNKKSISPNYYLSNKNWFCNQSIGISFVIDNAVNIVKLKEKKLIKDTLQIKGSKVYITKPFVFIQNDIIEKSILDNSIARPSVYINYFKYLFSSNILLRNKLMKLYHKSDPEKFYLDYYTNILKGKTEDELIEHYKNHIKKYYYDNCKTKSLKLGIPVDTIIKNDANWYLNTYYIDDITTKKYFYTDTLYFNFMNKEKQYSF